MYEQQQKRLMRTTAVGVQEKYALNVVDVAIRLIFRYFTLFFLSNSVLSLLSVRYVFDGFRYKKMDGHFILNLLHLNLSTFDHIDLY